MEIGIINSTSIAIILLFSDRLLSGIIGNLGYDISKKIIERIRNSDKHVMQYLQFAVHNSIIIALKEICLECQNELDAHSEDDIRWLRQKLAILDQDLKTKDISKYAGYNTNELNEIELSLLSSNLLTPNIKQHVKEKLIDAILKDEEAPACYEKKVKENLSDYVCSSLANLVQNDRGLYKIFNEQLLSDIQKDLQFLKMNLDNLLSSIGTVKSYSKLVLERTEKIENMVEKLAEGLTVETANVDVKIIKEKYITNTLKTEDLKNDTYTWLVNGWLTCEDAFTNSKEKFIFYKKYIPVYDYTGIYSGIVYATKVTKRNDKGEPVDWIPVEFPFSEEKFKEHVVGIDPSKALKLKPSELGSLCGRISNFLKNITPDFIYQSDKFIDNISIPLKKTAFGFLNPVFEDLANRDKIDKLEEIDLRDLCFKENDIELEDLTVSLDDFISEISERYGKEKNWKKNRVIKAHLKPADVWNPLPSISTTPEMFPKCTNIKIIYIPIWIAIYSYNDKKFVFVKNLSTLKEGGIRPLDRRKVIGIILASILLYIIYIKTPSLIFFLNIFIIFFVIAVGILFFLKKTRKDKLTAELGRNIFKEKPDIL